MKKIANCMNNIPEEKRCAQKDFESFFECYGCRLRVGGLDSDPDSIFTEKDTLKWGMLCIALGSILAFIRILLKPKEP